MLTVYAKLEPTTDEVTLKYFPETDKKDVQIYRDEACTDPFARFPWHYSSRPTLRNKYVTLNCYRWKLQWIKEVSHA